MGRRPGISRSEKLLRAKLAEALAAVIGPKRGAQARAAEQLGISRQAVSLYINGKATPSSEVLRRACAKLNLSLNVEGTTIDANSFDTPPKGSTKSAQLLLFDAISEVENQQLNVLVLRKGPHSIDLEVSIDFRHLETRLKR